MKPPEQECTPDYTRSRLFTRGATTPSIFTKAHDRRREEDYLRELFGKDHVICSIR